MKYIKWLALLVVATVLAGCVSTSTTGTYNAKTGELEFKSQTRGLGNTAIKNQKTMSFTVDKAGENFKIDATGETNLEAVTEIERLAEILEAVKTIPGLF